MASSAAPSVFGCSVDVRSEWKACEAAAETKPIQSPWGMRYGGAPSGVSRGVWTDRQWRCTLMASRKGPFRAPLAGAEASGSPFQRGRNPPPGQPGRYGNDPAQAVPPDPRAASSPSPGRTFEVAVHRRRSQTWPKAAVGAPVPAVRRTKGCRADRAHDKNCSERVHGQWTVPQASSRPLRL